MIFIGSLLLICFPLGNGRSLTEKRELPLKETIVPTPGNDSFQSRKFMETLSHSYTINYPYHTYIYWRHEERLECTYKFITSCSNRSLSPAALLRILLR